MSDYKEPTTVGLTPATKGKLNSLKEDGYFDEMLDAYRFAVGLALRSGAIEVHRGKYGTMFNVGSLDPSKELYEVVFALRDQDIDEPVYKTVERLAEWGIQEIYAEAQANDEIQFSKWLAIDSNK